MMVYTAAMALMISAFCLLGWGVVVARERQRGERIFLSRTRTALDYLLDHGTAAVTLRVRHTYRYLFQLHWYYSLHSILKAVLRVVVGVYTILEARFEDNRRRTKALRKERQVHEAVTHLTQMAAHKKETALTQKERDRLNREQLEA